MISFLNIYCTTSWIFCSFIFFSVVHHSRAQGDPTRIPTGDMDLRWIKDFRPWPVCLTDCSPVRAALKSSTEIWCRWRYHNGICSSTADYVRMSQFCERVGSSPCPADQCISQGEPEMLAWWMSTTCGSMFTAKQQALWDESTSQRKSYRPLASIGDRPACSDACPGLVTDYQSSVSKSLINITKVCAGLVDVDRCGEACTFGDDPRKLFVWVNNTCGIMANGTVRENWRNMTMAKEVAWVTQWIPSLFPWNWTVQVAGQPATLATIGIQVTDPITSSKPYLSVLPSGPGVCNTSTSEKLGVFAAVNVASFLLVPILGRRTVVNKLSFGYFGHLGSRGWPLMGMLSALLHVVANLLNAYVIRSTPGYENVPIGALALLWCTRPRVAWLAAHLAEYQAQDGIYFNCAASAVTSEAILQVLGSVYFGISAKHAVDNRFYILGSLDPYPRGADTHVMYAGALLWLVLSVNTFGGCIGCLLGLGRVIENSRKMMEEVQRIAATSTNAVADPILRRVNGPSGRWVPKWLRRILDRQGDDTPKAEPRRLTFEEIKEVDDIAQATMLYLSFLAQWLFWAGFVKAAKERYCPPKLEILGAIWTLFSAAGTFVGSVH